MDASAARSRCVVLVPYRHSIDAGCDEALRQLEERGYPVRRVQITSYVMQCRDRMATQALRDGFDALFWIDPNIIFFPNDVDRLCGDGEPLSCGVYPRPNCRQFACEFLPEAQTITFGATGGVTEIAACEFGFVYTHRRVYDMMRQELRLLDYDTDTSGCATPFFQPMMVTRPPDTPRLLSGEFSFCERARKVGITIVADTTIRLSVVASYWFSWEDAGSEKERFATYHFNLVAQPVSPPVPPIPTTTQESFPAKAELSLSSQHPPRNKLRAIAKPLPPEFSRFCACAVTYEKNLPSMELTRANFRQCDWGEELEIFLQPHEWPVGFDSAARNYCRALEYAAASSADFALIVEDDVRVCRNLRRNLTTIPLIQRDQCDFLSLYVPDTLQSPWERQEPKLGYRLARPMYSGPNKLWEKYRLWGSQAYVLSRRLVLACLDRWDRLKDGNDTRVISVCSELELPMWYTAPCLVQHAPLRSAHATPTAHAPDFDENFCLTIRSGFQPPEAIPGWLLIEEGRLLYEMAAAKDVLELGTCMGRSTVCLAQNARLVVSVDIGDQSEAREWTRRYGLADRVEFRCGDSLAACHQLAGRLFGLVFVDTEHDAESVTRDIECALPLLQNGGLIAFHDYPDPGWPQVRQVVDSFAHQLGW